MDLGRRNEKAELLAVVFLGILLRLFAGRNSLTGNGIILPGYDEFYHMRRILYTVDHFPNTLWFDSYLDYPYGFNLTWPPLFDQLFAALSLSLGQRSQPGVEMVSAFLPIVLGALAIVVIYFLIREIFDGKTALLAAFMTAIAPYYIPKTTIGAIDHHGLEVLLMLSFLLFLVMALSGGEQSRIFAALSGVMMAGLAYTWFGAAIYLGIFLVYAAVQITLDLRSGYSSRKTTITLLTAFSTALILVLPFWDAPWIFPSFLGIVAAIIGTLIMFAISRIMAERKVRWAVFPLVLLILASIFALLSPYLGMSSLIQQGGEYLFGGEMSGKIAEGDTLLASSDGLFTTSLFSSIGWKLVLNILFSLAGIAAFIFYIRCHKTERFQGQLLVLVWIIATLLLTIGQVRFLYLSTISMGILISLLFFRLLDLIERRMSESERQPPKVLAAVLLLLLILPTLAETASLSSSVPSIEGDWQEALSWLEENSNATSYYDNPVKTPEYSIMSIWDSGNWIVYEARRPVVTNNFQTGLEDSIRFYFSESEEAATAILDARGSRYVLTEYDMLYGKLPSLARWINEDPFSYLSVEDYGPSIAVIPTKRLLNTTMARLYFFDGAGTEHFRLIYESSTFFGANPPKSKVKIFEYVPGALIRVKTGPDQRVGALLNMTSNQDRSFTYINEGLLRNGSYDMRVPYSTEHRYGTHALGPYLIFSGNEQGVKMQNINVSEQDILDGNMLEVNF